MIASEVYLVSTATPTCDVAVGLGQAAVQARLAASAQVHGPVTSLFWPEGAYGTGEEWVLLLRTTADRYAELERQLVENHTWSNPEVIATPAVDGSAPYLDWVRRTTSRSENADKGGCVSWRRV